MISNYHRAQCDAITTSMVSLHYTMTGKQ